jgi:hypothetical protein
MSITAIHDLGIVESDDELFGHRNYSWRWQVDTDDPKEAPDDIVTDSRFIQKGWPLISEAFSDPRAVLLKQRVTKQENDPRIAIYVQSFSTNIKFPSGDAGSNSGPGTGGNGVTPATWPLNPLLQPPSIRGYYVREMESIEEDLRPENRGGPQPVVNALGEPLVPPIERARKLPAIAIGINKASIDERRLFDLQDAVNSDPWRNLGAGFVKAECEWHSEYDAQFGSYWHIDAVMVINFRGWNPSRFLNTSFNKREADPATGRYMRVPIRDKYGQPSATAQPINVDGKVLSPPIKRNGTLNAPSNQITALAQTSDLFVGDEVRGEGIPLDTTILSVDSGTQVTISNAATEAGIFLLTFGEPYYWLEFWEYPTMAFGGFPF